MSLSSIETSFSELFSFNASRLAFIPSIKGLNNFTSDHTPPTTIAPTPKYLILVVQMLNAASNGSPSNPTTAE